MPPIPERSYPLREWGNSLLWLGSILAVFSGVFILGQGLLADPAVGAAWIALALVVLGIILRVLDFASSVRSRGLRTARTPREVVPSEIAHRPRLPGSRLGELGNEDDLVDVRKERT